MHTQTSRPNKPFTLKALCVLLIFRSLTFLGFVGLLFFGMMESQDLGSLTGISVDVTLVLYLVIGVIFLVVAVGLWLLRPWAWQLTMITVGMLLIYGLWIQYSGQKSTANTIGLGVNIFIVFYLVQGEIRALFTREAATQEGA